MVSGIHGSAVAVVKIRTCLGRDSKGRDCEERFLDEGAHIRFCHRCRARNNSSKKVLQEDSLMHESSVSRVELQRWGVGNAGGIEETIDWS